MCEPLRCFLTIRKQPRSQPVIELQNLKLTLGRTIEQYFPLIVAFPCTLEANPSNPSGKPFFRQSKRHLCYGARLLLPEDWPDKPQLRERRVQWDGVGLVEEPAH